MSPTEYRDLRIPLGIRITPAQTRIHEGQWYATAAVKADPIIARHLASARDDGWEAAGPTTLVMLATQGNVNYVAKYGLFIAEWKYTDFISVTIRVIRVVR